ncbi:hypothetical protein PENTCL1PPCAC_8341, partial [Pristionchus entomophagus]
ALAGKLVRRSLSFSCISFLVFASNMALSLSTSSSESLIVSERRASPRWKTGRSGRTCGLGVLFGVTSAEIRTRRPLGLLLRFAPFIELWWWL